MNIVLFTGSVLGGLLFSLPFQSSFVQKNLIVVCGIIFAWFAGLAFMLL